MYGDIMFSFTIKVFFYLMIIFSSYYIFNKKEIKILESIIILFIFNICIYSLYNDINFINTLLIIIMIFMSYYLFMFLYNKNIDKKIVEENILINRGIINFNSLVKENISYNELLYELKKKGIGNPNSVDYCIKKDNNYLVLINQGIKNYPISLIIDGSIIKDNLFSVHKSIEWLHNKIEENNLELKHINYAYYKNQEVYFIVN